MESECVERYHKFLKNNGIVFWRSDGDITYSYNYIKQRFYFRVEPTNLILEAIRLYVGKDNYKIDKEKKEVTFFNKTK